MRPGRRPALAIGTLLLAALVATGIAAADEHESGSGGDEHHADAVFPEPKRTTVLDGLTGPIDIAIGPDGTIWWNEYYTGNVTRYDPATETREVVFHAPPIPDGVERGMLGLALDPDVAENGVFYVYYTVADPNDPDGGTNRLSRVDGNGSETVLLETGAHKMHNGGRILFAPDGSMFVSTGDNQRHMQAQEPGSLLGKILHLWPDGTPADDNIEGYVHTLGHRNVYGLAYDAENDRLFATENSNAQRDEVNLIQAGHNYGWPHCEGSIGFDPQTYQPTDEPCDESRYTLPIGEFTETGTVAPTGAAYVDGILYWAAWNQGQIHRLIEHTGTGEWHDDVGYAPGGRINDLEAAPDGSGLYYATWESIEHVTLPLGPKPTLLDLPSVPASGTAKSSPGVGALVGVLGVLAVVGVLRRR